MHACMQEKMTSLKLSSLLRVSTYLNSFFFLRNPPKLHRFLPIIHNRSPRHPTTPKVASTFTVNILGGTIFFSGKGLNCVSSITTIIVWYNVGDNMCQNLVHIWDGLTPLTLPTARWYMTVYAFQTRSILGGKLLCTCAEGKAHYSQRGELDVCVDGRRFNDNNNTIYSLIKLCSIVGRCAVRAI